MPDREDLVGLFGRARGGELFRRACELATTTPRSLSEAIAHVIELERLAEPSGIDWAGAIARASSGANLFSRLQARNYGPTRIYADTSPVRAGKSWWQSMLERFARQAPMDPPPAARVWNFEPLVAAAENRPLDRSYLDRLRYPTEAERRRLLFGEWQQPPEPLPVVPPTVPASSRPTIRSPRDRTRELQGQASSYLGSSLLSRGEAGVSFLQPRRPLQIGGQIEIDGRAYIIEGLTESGGGMQARVRPVPAAENIEVSGQIRIDQADQYSGLTGDMRGVFDAVESRLLSDFAPVMRTENQAASGLWQSATAAEIMQSVDAEIRRIQAETRRDREHVPDHMSDALGYVLHRTFPTRTPPEHYNCRSARPPFIPRAGRARLYTPRLRPIRALELEPETSAEASTRRRQRRADRRIEWNPAPRLAVPLQPEAPPASLAYLELEPIPRAWCSGR